MEVDKNGARIDNIKSVDNSNFGRMYVVMWDNSGIPIHIHKNVVTRLNNYVLENNRKVPTPKSDEGFDDFILEKMG